MEDNDGFSDIRNIERSPVRGVYHSRGRKSKERRMGDHRRKELSEKRRRRSRGSNKSFIIKIVFLVIVIVSILVFVMSTTFASAKVEIRLKTADITVDGVFNSTREPSLEGDVSYSTSGPFTSAQTATLSSVREEPNFSKAEGRVTLYNTNLSGAVLDLINSTRLQTEDGRIYRLKRAIDVPGGKDVDGEFQPGTIVVSVEADEFGTEYNLTEGGVRFSIPGLARFEAFKDSYAISNGPIVGGFAGKKYIPDEDEESEARERLRAQIEENLKQKLDESIKNNEFSNRVIFDDLIFISFKEIENEQVGESDVIIKEEGVLNAITFREKDLSDLLVQFSDESVDVPTSGLDVNALAVEVDSETKAEISETFENNSGFAEEISFRLSGNTTIYWDVDELLFFTDVKGKNEEEVQSIIDTDYPQVESVRQIRISPFWRSTIPNSRSKLNIEIE